MRSWGHILQSKRADRTDKYTGESQGVELLVGLGYYCPDGNMAERRPGLAAQCSSL